MGDQPFYVRNSLPSEALIRVDEACLRFEAAWQGGQSPRLEEYLEGFQGPERVELLRELLLLELVYRRERDEWPTPADFLARFPDSRDVITAVFIAQTPTVSNSGKGTGFDPSLANFASSTGYEILDMIGKGAMGTVFRARQLNLNRIVALKVLSGDYTGPEILERFREDAETLAQLEHPNLVQVFDMGEHKGRPFFAMEYVSGGTLAQWLHVKLPEPKRAAAIVESLARTMEAVHKEGVIHRDLKPANILITKDETPKITDFGLARKLNQDTGQAAGSEIVGTPPYMPPEQAQGRMEDVGLRSDVYGLGAVLYECLTGRPPFRAATIRDTLRQVVEEEAMPPRRLNRAVPRDLETICLKCLEKEPNRRYASALALAEDLNNFQVGKPIKARPIGWFGRSIKWARRRPAVATLTATLGIVVAMAAFGIGGAIWQWQNKRVAQEKADAFLYINSLALAKEHVTAGFQDRAWKVLEEDCPPSLRGWEWHFLRRCCLPETLELHGHSDRVLALAFRPPDSRQLVSAGADGTVRLWDSVTGEKLKTLDHHPSGIRCLAFSRDGNWLAWAADDLTVKVQNLKLSQEGKLLRGAGNYVALSPNGKFLASVGRGSTIKIFANPNWDCIRSLEHDDEVLCVTFCPDSKWVVAGGRGSKVLRAWDVARGQEQNLLRGLPNLSGKDWVGGNLAFSPDRRYLAALGAVPHVWDLQAPKEQLVPLGFGRCTSLAFSADGLCLGGTYLSGSVAVWETKTGKTIFNPPYPKLAQQRGDPLGVTFSTDPESKLLAFARGRTIYIQAWRQKRGLEGRQLAKHTGPVRSLAFSPDSQYLASGGADGCVLVWDLMAPKDLELSSTLAKPGKPVSGVAFHPDGIQVAAAKGIIVQIWNWRTGKLIRPLAGHTEEITGLAFSPDGRFLASSSADKTVGLWNTSNGQLVHPLVGHTYPVTAVAFRPDSQRLASASKDWTVKIWDVETAREIQELNRGHSTTIRGVAFSPDGQKLVSAGSDDTVVFQDLAQPESKNILRAHAAPVVSVSFDQNGHLLASADINGNIKVGRVFKGGETFTLRGPGETACVVFSPDGRFLASNFGNSVVVWDGGPLPDSRDP